MSNLDFNFIKKIRADFGTHGNVFVRASRKNHVFFERKEGGKIVATYDTHTSEADKAYFIIGGWIKNGFPEKRRKSMLQAFSDFCKEYWNENPDDRDSTKMHLAKTARWIDLYVAPYFKDTPVDEVTPQQVRDFLEGLKKIETYKYRHCKSYSGNRYLSPATQKQIRNAIHLPLEYATKKGLNKNATDWLGVCRIKAAKNKEDSYFSGMVMPRDILEKDELAKLDKAEWTDERARICYLIARYTGMRYGEIRGLKIGRVLSDRIIIDSAYNNYDKEKGTKTGQYREVPIPEWLYIEIHAYISRFPFDSMKESESWLFPNSRDFSIPIGQSFMIKKFDAMLKKLGIPKKRKVRGVMCSRSVHSLRHCKDMELLDAGLSIKQISDVIGHSGIMVAHYTNHYSNTEFDKVREKMSAAGLMDNPREKKESIVHFNMNAAKSKTA